MPKLVKKIISLINTQISVCQNRQKENKRFKYCKKYRDLLINKDFSLISNNCNGGIILHDLGVRFNTPTINVSIDAASFIEYLKHIDFYNNQELVFVETQEPFPVATICSKVTIKFVHYKSIEEAKQKWNERKKRINFNNLFIVMTQQPDEGCDDEIVHEFDLLPFKHKVIFTFKNYLAYKSSIYLEQYSSNPKGVYMFLDFINKKSIKRNLDVIDWVQWFNSKSEKPEIFDEH